MHLFCTHFQIADVFICKIIQRQYIEDTSPMFSKVQCCPYFRRNWAVCWQRAVSAPPRAAGNHMTWILTSEERLISPTRCSQTKHPLSLSAQGKWREESEWQCVEHYWLPGQEISGQKWAQERTATFQAEMEAMREAQKAKVSLGWKSFRSPNNRRIKPKKPWQKAAVRLDRQTSESALHQGHRKAATPHPTQALASERRDAPAHWDREAKQQGPKEIRQAWEACLEKNLECGTDQKQTDQKPIKQTWTKRSPSPLGPKPTSTQSRLSKLSPLQRRASPSTPLLDRAQF